MGWEGQQAGGSPGPSAGMGRAVSVGGRRCVQAPPGEATLLPGFTPECGHPPCGPPHCAQSRFPFPSIPRSACRFFKALLRGRLAPLRSLQPVPPSCAAGESSRRPPRAGEH